MQKKIFPSKPLICSLYLAALCTCLPSLSVAGEVKWTQEERALIASHGPWPPTTRKDPSNALSGAKAAIAFGKKLFFDSRLSRNGKVSCATCHNPQFGFSDGRPTAKGLQQGGRNSIGLWNVRFQTWFGWDGAKDSLWAASLRPIIDEKEMGLSQVRLHQIFLSTPDLKTGFKQATNRSLASLGADEVTVLVAKIIAAYQETLISPASDFDRFRDALMAGDLLRQRGYPLAAQRGLKLFIGKGQCNVCHHGPLFTNREFASIGRPFFLKSGGVDKGRYGGIQAVRASAYNRLGKYNDDPRPETTVFTRHLALLPRNWGEFKVPSLRNIKDTAPYTHDGSLETLKSVVHHYSTLDEDRLHTHGEAFLRALRLTDRESDDLVAFLKTL